MTLRRFEEKNEPWQSVRRSGPSRVCNRTTSSARSHTFRPLDLWRRPLAAATMSDPATRSGIWPLRPAHGDHRVPPRRSHARAHAGSGPSDLRRQASARRRTASSSTPAWSCGGHPGWTCPLVLAASPKWHSMLVSERRPLHQFCAPIEMDVARNSRNCGLR